MLKTLIVVLAMLSGTMACAAVGDKFESNGNTYEIEYEHETKMGLLKVIVNESRERLLYLKSQQIYPTDPKSIVEGWLTPEHVDYIGNNMVVLLHNYDGTKYGIDEWFFLTVYPDKRIVTSDSFPANTAKHKQAVTVLGEQIVIELNIPADIEGKYVYRRVIYKDGKVTMIKSKPDDADRLGSCKQLYELYLNQALSMCRKYDSLIPGMGDDGYGDYLDRGVYDRLDNAAKRACKTRKPIDMPIFKSQVCRLK